MYGGQIKELSINRMDTYNSNQEAIEIRTILNLKNQSLNMFTLNCMFYYTSMVQQQNHK
jgi:hypothetical protein